MELKSFKAHTPIIEGTKTILAWGNPNKRTVRGKVSG